MRIGPLFKWFGSKWSGAKHYPKPAHEHIIEPFAGSAGYALNYCDKAVTLYDINEHVWALWEWLINFAAWNPIAIKEIPIGIPEGTDIRSLGLTTGQELLLKNWQRTNNVGNCWTISPWGNKPGQWTANTRARVSEEVTAIKHWKLNQSEINYDVSSATYFIDPPYQFNYQYRCVPVDYKRLAAKINYIPFPKQVIVCEARCQKTGRLPEWLPFQEFRSQVTSRRKTENNHHSREAIFLL